MKFVKHSHTTCTSHGRPRCVYTRMLPALSVVALCASHTPVHPYPYDAYCARHMREVCAVSTIKHSTQEEARGLGFHCHSVLPARCYRSQRAAGLRRVVTSGHSTVGMAQGAPMAERALGPSLRPRVGLATSDDIILALKPLFPFCKHFSMCLPSALVISSACMISQPMTSRRR